MKRNGYIISILLIFVLSLTLCSCSTGEDVVKSFAKAEPDNSGSIAVPGYETLDFNAGKTLQYVNFKNPANNPCKFVLSLSLDDGTTIWTGEAISPGEEFTRIKLNKALDEGEYAAILHYESFSLQDNTPQNGADIQLTIIVK